MDANQKIKPGISAKADSYHVTLQKQNAQNHESDWMAVNKPLENETLACFSFYSDTCFKMCYLYVV